MKRFSTILFFAIINFLGIRCCAQDYLIHKATDDYLDIYQRFMSGLKNTRCTMYPSCSNYAKMVFQDYSFPTAMILTTDRLTRCSHDLEVYQTTYIHGVPLAVDYPATRTIPNNIITNPYITPTFVSNIFNDDILSDSIYFIIFLINQRNYQGAMYEIDRTIFNERQNVSPEIYALKLKCFEGLNSYKDGILAFEQSFPNLAKENYSTLFNAAHLYDLIGDESTSLHYYKEAIPLYSVGQNTTHPFGEIGKIYVKTGEYENAKKAFQQKLSIDNNTAAFNSTVSIIQELESYKRKDKNIALALSIIPGCGYLYTHQYKNAFTALILNGILGYASYTSFKSKNYGTGAILSVLTLSFYFGNMVGSGNSAKKYNNIHEREALDKLHSINPFLN